METINLTTDGNGAYRCDIPVSKEQWLAFLRDGQLITPEWKKVLLSFYFMPDRKASCTACAQQYGHSVNTYNSGISAIGRAVVKRLATFSIVDEDGTQRFWPVVMESGRDVNGLFEWTLRKELVEAMEQYLTDDAIEQYAEAFDGCWKNERYKWLAVKWFQEHWHIDDPNFASMIEFATAKTANLLASMNSFPRGMIVQLAKVAPTEVRDMFRTLYDENQQLSERVQQFMDRAEQLRKRFNQGDWNMHYQSTNAVSVYLWLRYPHKYYIYKYGEYRAVAEKLGLDFVFRKNGQVSEMIKGFSMYDMLNRRLRDNSEAMSAVNSHLAADSGVYPDPELRTATVDLGFWISRSFESVEKSLYLKTPVTMTPFISRASSLLRSKKNIILQGAPGTGKTYNTTSLALALIDGTVPEDHQAVMARYEQLRKERRIGFTTFHQSMDYEDFVEGIKPEHDGASIRYKVEDGIFKTMCAKAVAASNGEPYVLIIDEINRGNVSKIFGELITLLEKDKRIGDSHPITLSLPYSKTKDFGVPQNLYIIGTMNTTDRSTGTIDYAIRRRFAFVTIPADRDVIDSEAGQRLFDNVKQFIEKYKYADMDIDDLMVGHSYFMVDFDDELPDKMRYEVIPLVKEYIKDGILSVRPDEARLYFDAWQRLDTVDDSAAGTPED